MTSRRQEKTRAGPREGSRVEGQMKAPQRTRAGSLQPRGWTDKESFGQGQIQRHPGRRKMGRRMTMMERAKRAGARSREGHSFQAASPK